MAYSTSNPPELVTSNISGSHQRWMYTTADAAATVDASGYITNGGALGMNVGDLVEVIDTNLGIITEHRVVTVSATYPGAVNLSDGVVVGSSTNSD